MTLLHKVFALILSAIPFSFAASLAPCSQLRPTAAHGKTEETIEVILALQRNQALHVLDAATLETLGSFVAGSFFFRSAIRLNLPF